MAKIVQVLTRPAPNYDLGTAEAQVRDLDAIGEKLNTSEGWINGGFFVVNKDIKNYLDSGNECVFEKEPLENIAKEGNLYAYKHEGFWQCVDTIRELEILETRLSNI